MTISVIKTAINISEKGSVWTISGAPRTALVVVQNKSKTKSVLHVQIFFLLIRRKSVPHVQFFFFG